MKSLKDIFVFCQDLLEPIEGEGEFSKPYIHVSEKALCVWSTPREALNPNIKEKRKLSSDKTYKTQQRI